MTKEERAEKTTAIKLIVTELRASGLTVEPIIFADFSDDELTQELEDRRDQLKNRRRFLGVKNPDVRND